MKLFIHFLLISSLSIIIIDGYCDHLTESEIESVIKGEHPHITGTDLPSHIKLLEGGQIFRKNETIVWKGTYNDTVEVAIKIANNHRMYIAEVKAYEKLNATKDDFDMKTHRIPRIYHHGQIFGVYHAIVMPLFPETLKKRVDLQKNHFFDPTILLIFRQLVGILNFIHSNNVVHFNIKPSNIFISGQNVFLGDFGVAEIGEGYRFLDYNPLLQMLWNMARIPDSNNEHPNPAPFIYFEDQDVREAFQSILELKEIKGEYGIQPNYEGIIEIADKALNEIGKKSGKPVRFDWLEEGSPGASSSH